MPKTSRQTRQKQLLHEVVATFSTFFTAEQFYQRAQKRDPRLGIATVYRFLHDLTSNHDLHSYQCNRRTIYSSTYKSHCHFICRRCKKTSNFTVNNLDFLHKNMHGTICHFHIEVEGICEKCQENS